MVDFFIRLFCIHLIDGLLTNIGNDLTQTNVKYVAAFIGNCRDLGVCTMVLFIADKVYLRLTFGYFVALPIAAELLGLALGYFSMVESMYTEGLISRTLICQLILCILEEVVEKWINRPVVWNLFPIIFAPFAKFCSNTDNNLQFTIAFCFFIAGYKLGIREDLKQSLREVQNLVYREGFIQSIGHRFKDRQIHGILEVFWFIAFFKAAYTSDPLKPIFKLSRSILQYLSFTLVLQDVACKISWIVHGFLKWSLSHSVDEVEIGPPGNRSKIKDTTYEFLKLSILNLLIRFQRSFYSLQHLSIYPIAGAVLFNVNFILAFSLVLSLCEDTLKSLSLTLLRKNVWAHVRAVLITGLLTFLLCFFAYTSWKTQQNTWIIYFFQTLGLFIRTMVILVVYMLHLFGILWSNDVEQMEEKIDRLIRFLVMLILIGYALAFTIFAILTLLVIGISNTLLGMVCEFVGGAYVFYILVPDLPIWNAWKRDRVDTDDYTKKDGINNNNKAAISFDADATKDKNELATASITESEQREAEKKIEEEKRARFKEKFLDSRRKLKKEIYHKLRSFPWLCGAYGLTAANKIRNRPHLFLTVKNEMDKNEVYRQLKDMFKCDNAKDYFELLEEPEEKPNFKRVANRCENSSSAGSKPSTSDASVEAVPGGRVLVCGDREWNPMRSEKDGLHVMGSGTLTMFCCKDEQHYALICSHVGCITTDASHAEAAFKQEECIREIRGSLSYYEENAKKRKYYFENGSEENDNVSISFDNDNDESKRELLGVFHNNHFDDECDILSVKISNGIKINCKVVDVPPPDWDEIWNDLYERVIETPNVADLVKVVKISLSSTCHEGRIVATEFSYDDKEGELFHDTTVVKGDSGSFLQDGDSGALVCFFDKEKEKKVFAYGVFEVDQLSLPEGSTSNGPYAICLNLETSLEKLGFGEAGCFNACSGDRKSSSVCDTGDEELAQSTSSRGPGCDIL